MWDPSGRRVGWSHSQLSTSLITVRTVYEATGNSQQPTTVSPRKRPAADHVQSPDTGRSRSPLQHGAEGAQIHAGHFALLFFARGLQITPSASYALFFPSPLLLLRPLTSAARALLSLPSPSALDGSCLISFSIEFFTCPLFPPIFIFLVHSVSVVLRFIVKVL